MKLISIINANESVLDEQVFRNSSFGSFIAFVIFFVLFLAVVGHYYWYSTNYSVIPLGYIGYLWLGFWFGLIAKLAWSRLRSSFLPSNWLLKTSSDRLLIKFRSFQNYFYPETDPVVIEIYWRDVDWVRMTRETSSSPRSDTTETQFSTYLDMKLNLFDEELKEIKQGLVS